MKKSAQNALKPIFIDNLKTFNQIIKARHSRFAINQTLYYFENDPVEPYLALIVHIIEPLEHDRCTIVLTTNQINQSVFNYEVVSHLQKLKNKILNTFKLKKLTTPARNYIFNYDLDEQDLYVFDEHLNQLATQQDINLVDASKRKVKKDLKSQISHNRKTLRLH